jgi:glycerophosphoryl diester phosphodiesterase
MALNTIPSGVGFPLYKGIKYINDGILAAGEAKDLSNLANQKAIEALTKSLSLQSQINSIIVEGDSSLEAAAARTREVDGEVTEFSTLKERFDDTDQTIAEKADTSYVDGVSEEVDGIKDLMKGIKFTELAEPVLFAHRGAKNIFPEASMEAYRGCVNMGEIVLEMDIRSTTDGTFVCLHNQDMESTTNKTGNVDRYSAMGFATATIDTLPGWQGTPTLYENLLREFGNKVIYAPELKGSGLDQRLVDVMIKYNLQDNAIIQSFSAPDLTYAISKGLPVLYLKAQNDVTAATIKGWGINHVGLSTSLPDSYVTECLNAGLKVYMYTTNRRYEYQKYLSLGVHGFFTDDPKWVNGTSPVLEWDPYRDQVFTHGHFSPPAISDYTGGNRGTFVSPNKFGWPAASTKADFSLQGWIGELSDAFTLTGKMTLEKSVDNVRWGSIAFCTPKDYFDDYTDSLSQGYHLLIRESGAIDFYIRQGGPASSLNSMQTAAISEGQTVDFKIQVTSTQIIITRVDTGNSMTINNTVHRGGYVHFGRRLSGITFENVNVVSQ